MKKLFNDDKYTEEEKEKITKHGMYAGGTLAATGIGLGTLEHLNKRDLSENAEEIIKRLDRDKTKKIRELERKIEDIKLTGGGKEELAEKINKSSKGLKYGIGMTATGLALAGYSKYKHYKNKKAAESKEFSDAEVALARVQAAQINAQSRINEQIYRSQRAKMNDLRRAQRIQQIKTEAINRNLVQVSENAKDRVQNLNLFKTKSTIIKPKSMNKKAFNGYN